MRLSLALTIASVAISIQASAQTLPSSTGAAPTTSTANLAWSACSRFKPGHYVQLVDDRTRNLDGLAQLRSFLSKDVRNFRGVHYETYWGMIEKSPGVYDFSRLDAALAQVKAKNKYLQLLFKDRTFHSGCQSNFVPTYVNKDGSYQGASICFAKIWDKVTMDHMIRVLQQIALRYKADPSFLGITLDETSIGALSLKADPRLRLVYFEQMKRLYQAVHSVAPNLIVTQMMNSPAYTNQLYDLTNTLVGMGGGGAMGWPDTIPAKANEWAWYKIGRDYNRKSAVIPYVQTASIASSIAATEQIYTFLVDDIKAHMIVWRDWHKDIGAAYLTDVVIPTVNKHGGAVKNTLCPW
jgi:hypothetical protein